MPQFGHQDAYHLSFSQQNIWSVEKACPNTSINHICTTLHIHGHAELSALQHSVNAVLSADHSLRTRVTLQNGSPVQYHVPFLAEEIPVYDFSLSDSKGIDLWEKGFTREPMDILDAPLYRFALLRTGENSCSLVIKLHHLISDGWSQVMLCNRIAQCYLDLLDGRQGEVSQPPLYQTHVSDEERYCASSAYGRDEVYWKEQLTQGASPAMLKALRGASLSHVGNRLSFPLPEALNEKIASFCQQHRVAPFTVFYMALAIYLERTGSSDRFTIGVPVFNRKSFADKQTSGMFVSTLPFTCEISGNWSWNQLLAQVNDQWYDLLRHQRFPFSHIQSLSEGFGGSGPIFHIAFSYQNSQLLESSNPNVSFSGRWHYSGYQMEQLCIHLSNIEDDRRYCVDYDYLTQLFTAGEIHSLHSCLVNILQEALSCPDHPICQLSLLPKEEKELVLHTFNSTNAPLAEDGLYQRFSSLARQAPQQTALIWDDQTTTFNQLDNSAAQVHAALAPLFQAEPPLVAVLLPRSPELFAAMLGILRSGGAFLLLPPSLPENRVREILRQSGAAALLTKPHLGGHLSNQIKIVDVSNLPSPTPCPPAPYCPNAPAYVVYTSGSTGTPKGVEVDCRSLLNLAESMAPLYGKGAVLSMCSIGFDAFLLESVCPMLNGRSVVLPQEEELESPRALAALAERWGADFLSTTPSRLSACMKDKEFLQALSHMESIICGGEAFPSDMLQQLQLVTRARIYNQYGPSETTVAVSVKQLNGAAAITAGSPMRNCRLYVLDAWGSPLPVGVYGDLYVGGICVGRGYQNAPELTEKSFSDDPFYPGGRMYRTGDIACWTAEGEIVLSGRSDHQVKLRGLRIELQEIADCICRHPQVHHACAAVQQHSGQDVLVGFYLSEQDIPEEELLALCAGYLPSYMIPSAILHPDAFPLTANGKVDLSSLPRPSFTSTVYQAPTTPAQVLILGIFRQVLKRPDIGVTHDYFLCGGNSLNAMETLSQIGEQTGRMLRVTDLYTCRSAARLASLLERSMDASIAQHLTPAPAQERWPLSPIQQGIYVQSHLDPTGKTYHMAGAFRLTCIPDIPRLEQAFRTMIAQEPLLRTAFVSESDGIFARLQSDVPFSLSVFQGGTLEQASEQLLQPFDLTKPPLLRAALWEQVPGTWVLLFTMHHVISDGLTSSILLARLDALYQGSSAQPQHLSYLDYAWHLSRRAGSNPLLSYWKDRLASLPEPLSLPADFPRSHEPDFQGKTISHTLTQELSQACDVFCEETGLSPYMFFLGAFGLLLSRLSGKEDILVGAAAAGRLIPETRTMCGPFINTLPLRLTPCETTPLETYLGAVRTEVNAMLDHQQVGLEEIVSALGMKRTLSQSPLFQVIFSQRPIDSAGFSLGGAPMEYFPIPTGTARMELWTELSKENGCYVFHSEYATQLFREETIAYYGRCLETIIRSMLHAHNAILGEIQALSDGDRHTLIDIPNNTTRPFLNLSIRDQFAQRLAEDPDAPAVIFHGQTTTRLQLDQRACQIANLLAQAGAVPGCRVGIALSRNMDLVAAVLAIWKVGGAYVPLLAHYPEQRLNYMVEIAGITHILCDDRTHSQLPPSLNCCFVPLSDQAEKTFPAVALTEQDEAEILFTSGSTGRPKGVLMAWRSVANMAESFRKLLAQSDGAILCTTNVVFDMFNGEVVVPLSMGKTIVMADEEEMMLPWKLAEIIQRDGVTITQSTPSRVQMWLSNQAFCRACAKLDMMMYGGEVVTETLLRQAQTHSNQAIQVNLYGPTEGTVYGTTRAMDYRKDFNVGWPLDNVRAYVLDEKLRPVLPTAVGDLYLAGECVSVGYVNRPDLTQASYLPDPFFPGQRMYRTGDLGRLRLDGSYDFYGRRDAQVKLNGQRVELDEINGAFVSQRCALQAATVSVRRDDGSMELFTYYIPASDHPSDSEIRRRLSQVLPAYMLPSRMIPLDTMPSTPTGKINLRGLREMAESGGEKLPETFHAAPANRPAAPKAASPAPVTEAPVGSVDWILSLWRRVLNRSDVAADRSFFEQGGTSLAALSILSYYNNKKLTLSLAQFYDNPTAQTQAALFSSDSAGPDLSNCTPAENSYPDTVPALSWNTGDEALSCVLLTGATGFLGVHLLRELLDQGAEKVICTMRDGSLSRFTATAAWYFGEDWIAKQLDRIEIISADLSVPRLGLSAEEYQSLLDRITSIWNCAADVRHYASDSEELMRTNLNGTQEMIRLALTANVPLYHMSTTSVGGSRLLNGEDPAVFTEEDFYIGQDWQSNLYVRSKFLAENAIFQAIHSGLTARVFRLGRLVGRAEDGRFQKNPHTNAFWLTMRGFHALGAVPISMADLPMELTPIDWCAQAIVSLRCAPLTVYHLQSPAPPTAAQCVKAVIPGARIVPDPEFDRLLIQAPVDLKGNVLSPLINQLNQLKTAPTSIQVDSSRTNHHLSLAGFSLSVPGPEQLLKGFCFSSHHT